MITKLLKRTCSQCGSAWYVDPKNQNNADIQQALSTLNMLDSVNGSNLDRAVSQNTALNTQNIQNNLKTCKSCGSEKYTEQEIYIDDQNEETLKLLSGIKKCPQCAEMVKTDAKKCKHCGYTFTEEELSTIEKQKTELENKQAELKAAFTELEKQKEKKSAKGCLIVLLVFVIIGVLVWMCSASGEKKETKPTTASEAAKDEFKIYYDVYQAYWYISNTIEKPSDPDEVISLVASEKAQAKAVFAEKYHITADEIDEIMKRNNGYATTAFQKMKQIEEQMPVPKNY